MMTDWYEKMIKALQLNGKGERTQQGYARTVYMLTEFSGKPPDEITEEEPSRQVKNIGGREIPCLKHRTLTITGAKVRPR